MQFLELLEEQKKSEWTEARKMHNILCAGGDYTFCGHGPVEDFHCGLESFLGTPKKLLYEAMEKEHCDSADSDVEFYAGNYGINTKSKTEWNFVVDPSENNLKQLDHTEWPAETKLDKKNCRKPKPIDDFEDHLAGINVRLQILGVPRVTIIDMIALRIYSGPMGVKFNKMIRAHTAGHREEQAWRKDEERKLCLGNKYSTTIHVIQSAIAKLGKINPNEKG